MTSPPTNPTTPLASAIGDVPWVFDRSAANDLLSELSVPDAARDLVGAAAGGAPFLARSLRREAAWVETLWERSTVATLDAVIDAIPALEPGASIAPDGPFGVALRVARRRMALLAALADLGGVWSLDEVTAALTRFAEAAVSKPSTACWPPRPRAARSPASTRRPPPMCCWRWARWARTS